MKIHYALIILGLMLSSLRAEAKTVCVQIIGEGSITGPQVEGRFLEHLNQVRARWAPDCVTSIALIGNGEHTYVYDAKSNWYRRINPQVVTGEASWNKLIQVIRQLTGSEASGDTLRLYLGDHGAPQGTVMRNNTYMSPDGLRSILAPWYSKGGRVELLVDHCHAGKMLDVLFSDGKVRGCGLSISNEEVAFTENNFLYGSLTERARRNQSGELDGNSVLNQFTLSSDRFLMSYAQSHTPRDCYECSVTSLMPKRDLLDQLTNYFNPGPIDRVIAEMDRNFENLESRVPLAWKTGPIVQWNEIQRRRNLIDGAINTAVVNHFARNPAVKALLDQKTALQAKVATWIGQHPGQNVDACPEYFASLALDQKIGAVRAAFMGKKTLRDYPGLERLSFIDPGLTPEQAHNQLWQLERAVHGHRTWLAQKNAYLMRKAALLEIRKNNDQGSLNIYLQFRACEERSKL